MHVDRMVSSSTAFWLRTYSRPLLSSSLILRLALGGMCFTVSDMSVMMTTTYDNPLSEKQAADPHAFNTNAANTGPITRARLNCMVFRAIALGRCSLFTSDGTRD